MQGLLELLWTVYSERKLQSCLKLRNFQNPLKDDSDYLAFKETTWLYSKFVYRSAFLFEPVLPHSQPIQICCTMITNMQIEL